MLTEIQVTNYAVIAATTLELDGGMTALSGETGAGKSILVGALGLVLGDRADAGVVRDGADKTEISALFDASESVLGWLEAESLDADGECLVRRMVSREGRSRAWINGHAVTLQTLRALGKQLVDIHGQHMHQSLTARANQRAIIDSFGGNAKRAAKVHESYKRWHAASAELADLEQAQAERDTRLDLLRFQVQELEALAPADGEAAELETEQRRLAHAGRIAEGTAEALTLLASDEQPAAQAGLARAAQLVATAAQFDDRLTSMARLLAEAEIQVSEAVAELRDYADNLDLDPARRDYVEQRLATMQTLARKHRIEPHELGHRLAALQDECSRLDNAEVHREQLLATVAEARGEYDRHAADLHKARVRGAKKLDKAITAEIQELGMEGGRFVTTIDCDAEARHAHGTDTIEFCVSANVGQSPRPLSKVASGGELSRISLAIEVLAAAHQPVPTMVFDEVDTGVGGRIAEIIGQKLRQLGGTAQVLCVTHLPQVASQAHEHVLVTKLTDGKTTRTQLQRLSQERRVEEIARMLGGVKITDATRRHAEEMLGQVAVSGARRQS